MIRDDEFKYKIGEEVFLKEDNKIWAITNKIRYGGHKGYVISIKGKAKKVLQDDILDKVKLAKDLDSNFKRHIETLLKKVVLMQLDMSNKIEDIAKRLTKLEQNGRETNNKDIKRN